MGPHGGSNAIGNSEYQPDDRKIFNQGSRETESYRVRQNMQASWQDR
jgi:hypothetical protein